MIAGFSLTTTDFAPAIGRTRLREEALLFPIRRHLPMKTHALTHKKNSIATIRSVRRHWLRAPD